MRSGFTLIELLVVVALIASLSGLMMPMLGVARRAALRTQTLAVLQQTDSALRLFKQEYGAYPYQARYPNLAAGETFDSIPNRLGYALGTDITATNRAAVQADMAAAAAAYAYAIDPVSQSELAQPSPATYTSADVASSIINAPTAQSGAVVLNRMAQDRSRLALLAGDVALAGGFSLLPSEAPLRDHSSTVLVTTPHSAANPGWAADYLQGQIDPRYLRNDAICDAWGHALIYICQVVPGIHGTTMWSMGGYIAPFDPCYFGLGTQGFDPTIGPARTLLGAGRGLLLGSGRIRLDPADAGDGLPPPVDASYLPDASDLMHSDVRYSAAPGFEDEFELWSAGADGRFDYWRDDPSNRDNLSVQPYTRGLP